MNDTLTLDHQLTLQSKSSFLYSFFLLPKEKRQAIYTLYAFCRQTDDIADDMGPLESRISTLNRWERELKHCFYQKVGNYFESLKQVAEHFKIPVEHFLELIAGVRMDLHDINYRSFDDLKVYCYRVASIVGLMCIQIFGYRDPVIKDYAENLGIALQLTNIMRDVAHDADIGRVYLPKEELDRFGVTRAELEAHQFSDRFEQLMIFQAERAQHYYDQAEACLPESERRNMLVAEIMKNIYYRLYEKMQERHYDVLSEPVRVSKASKIWITAKTFSGIKLLG